MWVGKRKFCFQLGKYNQGELVRVQDKWAYIGIEGEWSKPFMRH